MVAALGAALLLTGCGGGAPSPSTTADDGPRPPHGLAIGLGEANPHLFAPGRTPDGFAAANRRLAALRPVYVRLAFDWAKTGGDLAWRDEGCARDVGPCAPFAGLRDQLRALAARQDREHDRWNPVVAIYGVPDRYARPAGGCERDGDGARSRPITDEGLAAYRRLVRNILALGRREGAPIAALSPWNEPNHPMFISPQRERCAGDAPSLAARTYARLAAAARDVLAERAPGTKLVLGELAGLTTPSPRRTAIGELVGDLPDDLACAADVWAVHEYARADGRQPDAVGALRAALSRRACTKDDPIWVTETGALVGPSGHPRPAHPAPEVAAAACRVLARALARWAASPHVDAAFQYTFRDDPAYPVGLADAALTRTYPVYDLWRTWSTLAPGAAPPTSC